MMDVDWFARMQESAEDREAREREERELVAELRAIGFTVMDEGEWCRYATCAPTHEHVRSRA